MPSGSSSWNIPIKWVPGADPGSTGEIISLSWTGKPVNPPGVCWEIGRNINKCYYFLYSSWECFGTLILYSMWQFSINTINLVVIHLTCELYMDVKVSLKCAKWIGACAPHCNYKQKAFSPKKYLTFYLHSLSFFTYIWSLFNEPVLCACCLNRTLLAF